MLDPLRFARLPRDHRYRIRGGGRVLGREDVVEYREAAGPLPEERNGVAVDVRHDQARELRSLGNRWRRRPSTRSGCTLRRRTCPSAPRLSPDPRRSLSRPPVCEWSTLSMTLEFCSGPIRNGWTVTVAPCDVRVGLGEARRIAGENEVSGRPNRCR